jgi:quercetin dioxygenase-like cupin family protein
LRSRSVNRYPPSMTHKEYVEAVAAGKWPSDPRVPQPRIDHSDERGLITNLLLLDVACVSEINSRRGAVRANHWHREDWHFAYVVSGRVAYLERAVDAAAFPEVHLFAPGELFFTPPGREHAMVFLEDARILTFSRRRRDHTSHEEDVVRVDFVPAALVAALLR